MTEHKYLTTAQAAQELDVNRVTLQRWVSKYGITPALTTAGGHYRWDLDDLRRQLAELNTSEEN